MEVVQENGSHKAVSGTTLLTRFEKLLTAKRIAEQQMTNLDRQIVEVRDELQRVLQLPGGIADSLGTTNGANGVHGISFAKRATNGHAKGNGISASPKTPSRSEAQAFAVRRLEEVDADPRVRRSMPEILAFLELQAERRGTVPEIHTGTGLSLNAVRSRLQTALKYKLVRRVGGGKFALI